MQYELDNLKKIRKQLEFTQAEFAKNAGVSQSLIAKIEAGNIDPTYSKVKQIFEAIDRLGQREEITAADIMQKEILTAKPNDHVFEIVKLMKKNAISQVPILEGRNIIGLVTEKEMLEKIGDNNIHNLKARDIMIDPPPIISKETKMSILTSLIRYYPILLVANKGEMAGVITKSDILTKIV